MSLIVIEHVDGPATATEAQVLLLESGAGLTLGVIVTAVTEAPAGACGVAVMLNV